MKLKRSAWFCVGSILLAALAGCSGEDDINVSVKLLSATPDLPLPEQVETSVTRLEVAAWRGDQRVWAAREGYNGPFGGASFPKVPYGDDILLVVQAFADGQRPVASGATPRVRLSASSPQRFLSVPMTVPESFTRAFVYSFLEDTSEPFRLEAGPRMGASVAAIGGGAYLMVGGTRAGDAGGTPFGTQTVAALEVYDAATGEVLALADAFSCDFPLDERDALRLSTPRIFHTTTVLPDGRIVVAGGFTPSGSSLVATDAVEIITITNRDRFCGDIETIDPLFTARGGHTATLVEAVDGRPSSATRLLFVGGASGTLSADGSQLNTEAPRFVEEIRIPTRAGSPLFVEETDLEISSGRAFHQATWVYQQSLGLVLVGGVSRSSGGLSLVPAIENIFEVGAAGSDLDTYIFSGDTGLRRLGHGLTVVPAPNPNLYPDLMVIGGYGELDEESPALFSGTPAADVIRLTPAVDRAGGQSVFVLDRDLAVALPEDARSAWGSSLRMSLSGDFVWAGGLDGEGSPRREAVRLFLERDGSLSIDGVDRMSRARAFAAATELSSHLLLFVGGLDAGEAHRDADFYNPDDFVLLGR